MKKIISLTVITIIVLSFIALNINKNNIKSTRNKVLMMNIEALAQGEFGDDGCPKVSWKNVKAWEESKPDGKYIIKETTCSSFLGVISCCADYESTFIPNK